MNSIASPRVGKGGPVLYLYPKTKIFREVLTEFRQTRVCRAILIAILWPQEQWFPDLIC